MMTSEQRTRISTEAAGKVVETLEWEEDGQYWVLTFTDGTELSVRFMADQADTRRVEVSPVRWTEAPPCQAPAADGRRCGRPVGHSGAHDWQADTSEPPHED